MTEDSSEIKIFACLDYIRDAAPAYAKAKAARVYLEQYRKTQKALCMRAAEQSGKSSAVIQEREAYADPSYISILEGLREAVEQEELLRWRIVAAQAKIEVWRSIGANERQEKKVIP